MPPCVESGYALFADGKLLQFDDDSNEKVEALLKKAPKDQKGLAVVVEGTVSDDTIKATSIKPAGPMPVSGGKEPVKSTGLNTIPPR